MTTREARRESLLKAAQAVVDAIERDEAQHGGLLGRDSLRLVGLLRLELQTSKEMADG